MAENSAIEWTDHTFNPWEGCTKVSTACDNCYAEDRAKRYKTVEWGAHAPRRRTSADNWRKPLKWNRDAEKDDVRRKVFCASLADVFDNHKSIKEEWRDELWKLIEATPHLDWLLLTKRPQNVSRMVPGWIGPRSWPSNVWLGTTVENQIEAERRIPHLLAVPAKVRFLSCEPLLGPVDLTKLFGDGIGHTNALTGTYYGERAWQIETGKIHWVIAGGESGKNARPSHPDWFRALRDQCAAAGVPFLFKQWGEWLPLGQSGFTAWSAANQSQVARMKKWMGFAHFNDGKGGPERMKVGPLRTCNVYPSSDNHIGGTQSVRLGKKAAGRMLDGILHDGFPRHQEADRPSGTFAGSERRSFASEKQT